MDSTWLITLNQFEKVKKGSESYYVNVSAICY